MKETIKITATANKNKRTFTIRKSINGQVFSKYRTFKMSKEEFQENENNTENDWKQFLTTDEYFVVK